MTTVLVTSRDQIIFRVESNARNAPFERTYAARTMAVELEQQTDFARVRSLDDLVPHGPSVTDLPEPPPARPQLRLIQGGRP